MSTEYGDAGQAVFQTTDVYGQVELFAGGTPLPVTEILPVGENTELEAFTAVALDANENVVIATQGTPAIGITTGPVATGAGETSSIGVFRCGNFNPAAITFDASYTTLEQKVAAFRGADAPTTIIVTPHAAVARA